MKWVYWYVREVSTAVIVANIPHCWVMVRKVFHVRSFLSNGTSTARTRAGTGAYARDGLKVSSNPVLSHQSGDHGRWYKMKMMSHVSETDMDANLSRSGSEERINTRPLEIYQKLHYGVEEESAGHREPTSDVDSIEKADRKDSPDFDGSPRDEFTTRTTVTAVQAAYTR